jgi:hypothetical protein
MAASRSMLESLLARVRQRAAEPRSGAMPAIPPLPVPRMEVPASSTPAASAAVGKPVIAPATLSSSPVLETVAALEEEEVEEYDEELIEILDDGDVASESGEVATESAEDSSPIELRAASAAEMRRRSAPTTRPPAPRASAAPAVVAAPAAVAPVVTPAPAAAALRADVVARRPVPEGAVVQSPAPRPDTRTAPFVELLEASLRLGG